MTPEEKENPFGSLQKQVMMLRIEDNASLFGKVARAIAGMVEADLTEAPNVTLSPKMLSRKELVKHTRFSCVRRASTACKGSCGDFASPAADVGSNSAGLAAKVSD